MASDVDIKTLLLSCAQWIKNNVKTVDNILNPVFIYKPKRKALKMFSEYKVKMVLIYLLTLKNFDMLLK